MRCPRRVRVCVCAFVAPPIRKGLLGVPPPPHHTPFLRRSSCVFGFALFMSDNLHALLLLFYLTCAIQVAMATPPPRCPPLHAGITFCLGVGLLAEAVTSISHPDPQNRTCLSGVLSKSTENSMGQIGFTECLRAYIEPRCSLNDTRVYTTASVRSKCCSGVVGHQYSSNHCCLVCGAHVIDKV